MNTTTATETPAARFHAHYAAQAPTTSATVSRNGQTFEMARFADASVAFRVDGGRWQDHWGIADSTVHALRERLEG